jgi:sugar phosphate isomerase/epimerase
MKTFRCLAVSCFVALAAIGRGGNAPAFFAMDTIAKGRPDAVVPLLQELGYDGLGGAAGDRAMAEALQAAGLRFFNGYVTVQLQADVPGVPEKIAAQLESMRGLDTVLWLAVSKIQRTAGAEAPARAKDDEAFAARLREIAHFATERGVHVALYPHTGHYLEHFEDAIAMAERLDDPRVGVTFNLCHWLKVEGSERDPLPLLQRAGRRLMFVTINGADSGDTKTMTWARLIQPLGEGTYDVAGFLRKVRAAGFRGPVGFQGFGIKSPPREVLTRTMAAWKQMNAAL